MLLVICLLVLVVASSESENSNANCLSQYESFLIFHKKPMEWLQNTARLSKFCNSLSFVAGYTSNSYSLALNEKADLLDEEIKKLFVIQSVAKPSMLEPEMLISNDLSSAPYSLNWASSNNKYGYSVVPLVQDQV